MDRTLRYPWAWSLKLILFLVSANVFPEIAMLENPGPEPFIPAMESMLCSSNEFPTMIRLDVEAPAFSASIYPCWPPKILLFSTRRPPDDVCQMAEPVELMRNIVLDIELSPASGLLKL